jgi:hypothetical protein
VTPETIRRQLTAMATSAPAGRTELLKDFERVIGGIHAMRYGRDGQLDERAAAALDEALGVAARGARQIAASQTWVARALASVPGLGQQAWSR